MPEVIFIGQRLAMVIPIIAGTVKKHNGGPVCCRPLCEACLKIGADINYFYIAALIKGPQHPATDGQAVMPKAVRPRNVACDL